mgnify:CR=1 FL=1
MEALQWIADQRWKTKIIADAADNTALLLTADHGTNVGDRPRTLCHPRLPEFALRSDSPSRLVLEGGGTGAVRDGTVGGVSTSGPVAAGTPFATEFQAAGSRQPSRHERKREMQQTEQKAGSSHGNGQHAEEEQAGTSVRMSRSSLSMKPNSSGEVYETDAYNLEIYDSAGVWLHSFPLDHFGDIIRFHGDRMYIYYTTRKCRFPH